MERWGYTFNRVSLEDGSMMDHLAFLKGRLGLERGEDFSIWDMYLAGPLVLKSYLESEGIEVLLINHIDANNEERAIQAIQQFDPALVALSTTFILSPAQLNAVAHRLRRHLPHAFIVAGGQHIFASLLHLNEAQQRSYLKATPLDAFINDPQGEASLLQLVRAFPGPLDGVPNLLFKLPGGTVKTTERRAEHNSLSVPLRLDGIPEGSVVHLRTGRGCSFHCAFCSYPATNPLGLMEVDDVIRNLRHAREKQVRSIVFVDDTLNVPRPRFEAILDGMIAEGFDIPWYSFLRCQFIEGATVEKMRRTGCRGVFLGIESAAATVLSNIGKGACAENYARGIHWLKEAGITTVGSFVMGFPGETAETLQQTEAFINDSGLDFYFMQLFYYLHHTPVHEQAAKYGLKGRGLLWSHSTMDWQQAADHMEQMFLRIRTPAVHQDYNLWEIAFLESKGLDQRQIRDYRATINEMTAAQIRAGRRK
jgi:p-methyltransferase